MNWFKKLFKKEVKESSKKYGVEDLTDEELSICGMVFEHRMSFQYTPSFTPGDGFYINQCTGNIISEDEIKEIIINDVIRERTNR